MSATPEKRRQPCDTGPVQPETAQATSPDRGKYGTKRAPHRKRFGRTSIAEDIEVMTLAARGVSHSDIARITGLSVQRVNARVHAAQSTTPTALGVLQAAAHQAARDWVRSFEKAAKRGEHRPMRDALIAVGVVAPDAQNVGITVIVGSGDVANVELDVVDVQAVEALNQGESPSNPVQISALSDAGASLSPENPYTARVSKVEDKTT